MGSGTLLCLTPSAKRPSGSRRGESRSWGDFGRRGALEARGSSGNSQGAQCTSALGRCGRHAIERLGRRGAGCGTSPSKARATDAVVTGLCRGYVCRVTDDVVAAASQAAARAVERERSAQGTCNLRAARRRSAAPERAPAHARSRLLRAQFLGPRRHPRLSLLPVRLS